MRHCRITSCLVAILACAAGAQLYANDPYPDDPLFARQWYLENAVTDADIDILEAWRITRGSPRVTIAIIDDGVDLLHPDLAPNAVGPGRDFTAAHYGGDAHPKRDADRHGTAVAGLAVARDNDGIGIAGVCPSCSLLAIRAPRDASEATAAAFRYALEAGADVIVNSWGYSQAADGDAVVEAIDQAAARGRGGRGAVVVFGVTNELVDNCVAGAADIASLESVIAVGVSNHEDRTGFSGYGDCLDLVAPAKPRYRTTAGVLTTDLRGLAGYTDGDYYSGFGGTSAAAPLVAGVAGLLLSLNPGLGRADVQRILEHTADEIDAPTAHYNAEGFSPLAGHGRINAAKALVPTVRIHASPTVVVAGDPFDLTVTASAPHGVGGVSWRGRDTPAGQYEWQEDIVVDGRAYYRRTWTGLRLAEPGTFRFEALVRDAADSDANDAYPHVGRTNPDIVAGLITVTARGR